MIYLIRDETAANYRRLLRGEITRQQFADAPTRNGVIVGKWHNFEEMASDTNDNYNETERTG